MEVEKFIENFKLIEKELNRLGGYTNYKTFKFKLDQLSKTNSLIQKVYHDLDTFAKLRNLLSHEPKNKGIHIAKPSEHAVNRITEICQLLINPQIVFPKFRINVLGAEKDDRINNIFQEMYLRSFSQFPILENGLVIELINTNTISRWLSYNIENHRNIPYENIKICDFIEHIEFKENYDFVSKKSNVYDALEKFTNQIKSRNRNLDALFITQNGNACEKAEGIITIEDIAEFIN